MNDECGEDGPYKASEIVFLEQATLPDWTVVRDVPIIRWLDLNEVDCPDPLRVAEFPHLRKIVVQHGRVGLDLNGVTDLDELSIYGYVDLPQHDLRAVESVSLTQATLDLTRFLSSLQCSGTDVWLDDCQLRLSPVPAPAVRSLTMRRCRADDWRNFRNLSKLEELCLRGETTIPAELLLAMPSLKELWVSAPLYARTELDRLTERGVQILLGQHKRPYHPGPEWNHYFRTLRPSRAE